MAKYSRQWGVSTFEETASYYSYNSFTTYNPYAAANIPPYSTINKVTYTVYVRETSNTSSLYGNGSLQVYFTDANGSRIGDYLYEQTGVIPKSTTEYLKVDVDITPYVKSGTADAGQLSYGNAARLGHRMYSSGLLTSSVKRTYQAYKIVTWEYTPPSYTITTASDPSNGGTVTGGGSYEHGKKATLTAVPADGYVFSRWADGNTANPRTVDVTGNATYTAVFEVNTVNNLYVGTTQVKDIYVGTQKAKAVYVGTTKVYG